MADLTVELPPFLEDLPLLLALTLTLLGLILHLFQPNHRHSLEERIKQRAISAADATRRMRRYRVFAPTLTLLGVTLTAVALFKLSG